MNAHIEKAIEYLRTHHRVTLGMICFIVGFVVCALAHAQVGDTTFRRLASGGSAEVRNNVLVETLTAQNAQTFEWGLASILRNGADAGENVAIYGQSHRFGQGHIWAAVFETRDNTGGSGNTWGVEIDAMAHPAKPFDIALGVIVGRAAASIFERDPAMPSAHVTKAITVEPLLMDRGKIDVSYGLLIDVPCTVACVSVPAGSAIQLDGGNYITPQATVRFDPQTGYVGFWNGAMCLWCVNASNGDIRQMWTP